MHKLPINLRDKFISHSDFDERWTFDQAEMPMREYGFTMQNDWTDIDGPSVHEVLVHLSTLQGAASDLAVKLDDGAKQAKTDSAGE